MILQGAGDDLRCRGGVGVGEDDERKLRGHRVTFGLVQLRDALPVTDAQDFLSAIEEQVGHLQRLVEEATRVAAQVEYKSLGSLALQAEDLLGQFAGGRLVEVVHRHIRDLAIQHDAERNGRDPDGAPREVGGDRVGPSRARELGGHLGAGLALELRRHLLDAPATRARGVDLNDLVALADSRLLRRRVRVDLGDDDAAFLLLDEHAHAAVETTGRRVERLELLGRVELGVGVLEFLQQAAGGPFVEGAGADRVDEAIADDRHHLLEQAYAVARGAFLDDETAGHDRCKHNGQGEQRLASTSHTSLAEGISS